MRRPLEFDNKGEPGLCFGCGPDNAEGLGLSFFETDDGVETEYTVAERHAGAPGVVHGGILATLLDEVLCMTAYAKAGSPVVTGELTVRYLEPSPTGERLVVQGELGEHKGRSVLIQGRVRHAEDGRELARAHGRFFFSDPVVGRGELDFLLEAAPASVPEVSSR